jgi:hypothetical protein
MAEALALGLLPWRIVLCDLRGRPIALYTTFAFEKEFEYVLNRPARCSFVVPAEEPLVNILHTDGEPYLSCGNRTIKAYRREGNGNWMLRFAGIIMQTEEQGDPDKVTIAVNAFDPLLLLQHRPIRRQNGDLRRTVRFVDEAGAIIAKKMVNRTIQYDGPCGIETTGAFASTSAPQTLAFDQQFIGDGLVSMTDTATLDLVFAPVDRTDGILVKMSAIKKRGTDKSGSVSFDYGIGEYNVSEWRRTRNTDQMANDVTIIGGRSNQLVEHRESLASQTKYHTYVDMQTYSDIQTPEFLDALAVEMIALRKKPREIISVTPLPERAPSPWTDYFLGDIVNVQCEVKPSLPTGSHQIISGVQRIYGITISVDENGFEKVAELVCSPDGAT